MKHIIIAFSLITLGAIVAPGNGKGPMRGERPPRPSADEVAARVVVDFDTDSSLSLDADELTTALAFLHENRPPPPPRRDNPDTDRSRRPVPDFAALATELVISFDEDSDQHLSEAELVAAFNELHSRHGPPLPADGPGRQEHRN